LAAVPGRGTGVAVGLSVFDKLSLMVTGDPQRERCRKISLDGE
jgi:hypothetical protein